MEDEASPACPLVPDVQTGDGDVVVDRSAEAPCPLCTPFFACKACTAEDVSVVPVVTGSTGADADMGAIKSGTVKFWDSSTGDGFIAPVGGGPEVLVYRSALKDGSELVVGEFVRCRIELCESGPFAIWCVGASGNQHPSLTVDLDGLGGDLSQHPPMKGVSGKRGKGIGAQKFQAEAMNG